MTALEKMNITFTHLAQRIVIALLFSSPAAAYSQSRISNPVVNRESEQLFAYHRSKDWDLQVISSKDQDGVGIQDVSYASYSPRSGRIKAYIIRPSGKGPFAGVLFFHWLS